MGELARDRSDSRTWLVISGSSWRRTAAKLSGSYSCAGITIPRMGAGSISTMEVSSSPPELSAPLLSQRDGFFEVKGKEIDI